MKLTEKWILKNKHRIIGNKVYTEYRGLPPIPPVYYEFDFIDGKFYETKNKKPIESVEDLMKLVKGYELIKGNIYQ